MSSLTFPADENHFQASNDETIKFWETASGRGQRTVEGQVALGYSTSENLFEVRARKSSQVRIFWVYVHPRDEGWLQIGSQNLLWLPSDYRAACSPVEGGKIAIGCKSGRVLLLQGPP